MKRLMRLGYVKQLMEGEGVMEQGGEGDLCKVVKEQQQQQQREKHSSRGAEGGKGGCKVLGGKGSDYTDAGSPAITGSSRRRRKSIDVGLVERNYARDELTICRSSKCSSRSRISGSIRNSSSSKSSSVGVAGVAGESAAKDSGDERHSETTAPVGGPGGDGVKVLAGQREVAEAEAGAAALPLPLQAAAEAAGVVTAGPSAAVQAVEQGFAVHAGPPKAERASAAGAAGSSVTSVLAGTGGTRAKFAWRRVLMLTDAAFAQKYPGYKEWEEGQHQAAQ
jgi:hypothetical protein